MGRTEGFRKTSVLSRPQSSSCCYPVIEMHSVHKFVLGSVAPSPVLRRQKSNAATPISSEKLTISPSAGANIKIDEHPNLLADVSCAVFVKSSRVFARVDNAGQAGDDELGLSLLTVNSGVFLEGSQMRMGVEYLVSPNAVISFGEEGNECFVVEFEEDSSGSSGGDAMSKLLMQGMAAGASKDVREALEDKL